MRRRFFFSFGRRQALDIAQHACLKSVIREEFGRQLYTSSFEPILIIAAAWPLSDYFRDKSMAALD